MSTDTTSSEGRRPGGRSVPWSGFLIAVLFVAAGSRSALAQQGSLSGVVRDAASGAPIAGAVLLLERGARAVADSTGAFVFADVALGEAVLRVQRFGYRPLELRVVVSAGQPPLEVELEPDPVQLEALTARGTARVQVAGRVTDARTGEPVPWASLWLTPDAVREAASASGDEDGEFEIDDVPTGIYLLLVEKLGYVSQYVSLGVTAPQQPITVALEPDSAVQAGLEFMIGELTTRRNAAPFASRVFDEQRLRASVAPDVRRFLRNESSLVWTTCGLSATMDCVMARGSAVVPRVFIDEMVRQLEELESYMPEELYQLETFTCGRRVEIRAYTHEFIAERARLPRVVLPPCS